MRLVSLDTTAVPRGLQLKKGKSQVRIGTVSDGTFRKIPRFLIPLLLLILYAAYIASMGTGWGRAVPGV